MGKQKVWILVGIVMIIGLATGCGSSNLPKPPGEGDTSPISNAKLKTGDMAPDFRLPDHTGGYVKLSDYRGKSNVVIAFYPAAFTPV